MAKFEILKRDPTAFQSKLINQGLEIEENNTEIQQDFIKTQELSHDIYEEEQNKNHPQKKISEASL